MAEDRDLEGDGDAEEECECVAQFFCSVHDRDHPGSGMSLRQSPGQWSDAKH